VPDAPPQPSRDDERLRALMGRYQAGDLDAFEELYTLTLPMVRGYLAALAIDRAATVDLTQEVFLQAHRSRHTYDAARPFRPWLAGITRHVWLMERRAFARRRAPEVLGLDDTLPLVVAPDLDALGDRRMLGRALAQVPAEHREALVLHHVYGFSFREIARVLGISEGAARIRASRGMGVLRARLAGRRHD
jgi:RNA polymerase sigma-70 factor (ECF subfamily)